LAYHLRAGTAGQHGTWRQSHAPTEDGAVSDDRRASRANWRRIHLYDSGVIHDHHPSDLLGIAVRIQPSEDRADRLPNEHHPISDTRGNHELVHSSM
jgi:hypothetical protein